MFCHHCGKELTDDSRFCPYCGSETAHTNLPAPPSRNASATPSRRIPFLPILIAVLLTAVIVLMLVVLLRNPAAIPPIDEAAQTPATETQTSPPDTKPEEPDVPDLPESPPAPEKQDFPEETDISLSDAVNSVLYLEIFDAAGNFIGSGSGFLAIGENILVTNYHVVQHAYSLTAWTPDGEQYADISTLLAYDATADLAIVQLDSSLPGILLPLADSDHLAQGDGIYAVGYPLGLANTVSNGIVSARYTDWYGVDLIQITAPISHGNSGGPLLDEHGHVVGVICA